MQTSDYLEQLQQDKQDLVDNLTEMGIEDLTGDETFTELVPEVLNIETGGGGDASEYFEDKNSTQTTSKVGGWLYNVKKMDFPLSSSRTSLSELFRNFKGTNLSSINTWNTSAITSLYMTFYGCVNLTELNLNNWNVEKVVTCQACFNDCSSLTSIDLSNWNTIALTNTYLMFGGCSNLTSINLRGWVYPTSAVFSNCGSMFYNCSKLNFLDIGSFEFNNNMTSTSLFTGIPNNCLIIVKDQTQKDWVTAKFTNLTNVQTVAEYEAL